MMNVLNFDPFEENPTRSTPTNNTQSINIRECMKKSRVSRHFSLLWSHFTIISKTKLKGEVENVVQCKYCQKNM